jgi:anthranilate 3-monooxygenase (FAD)/4-hydroxyphenylacetate 3-monooxygenase
LIFNNVFVPWERVFCYRDVALSNSLYTETAIRNHTAHQTNTRALVKFQFAAGVALKVARSIKADQFLHVQEMLGECVNTVEFIKSGLVRSETECEETAVGTVRAALPPLQALRSFLPRAYPRVIEAIQTIAAGGLMMMPSGKDFTMPDLRDDMNLYYEGAGINSVDRVRLFKLAWDLAGEAFGTRALQYERYYAGDPVRVTAGNYLAADDGDMIRLVDAALALAGHPAPALAAAE